MDKTIDMQLMRYLNLFEKISRVRTKNCAMYNSGIIFLVDSKDIAKAIGESGSNIKRISSILNRKAKVVALPKNAGANSAEASRFIEAIVYPVKFRGIEISNEGIIINAGRMSKAALIGRDKARLHELEKITREYLNKGVRIV